MTTSDTPFLVATLGTDNHRFHRCVGWLDSWLVEHPEVEALVQYGYSTPPRHGSAVAMLPRQELIERMAASSVVVTHGGGGSMMDARAAGRVPVVVPRSAVLGEHVDDHQLHFSCRLADVGWVHLAETEDELHKHLDYALENPSTYHLSEIADLPIPASAGMDDVLAEILHGSTRSVSVRRVGHMLRFALRDSAKRRIGKWTPR